MDDVRRLMGLLDLDPSNGLTGGGLMNPQAQGLLGLSAALMSAGGPQRTPTSFGQALSQGMQGGIQSFGQARQGQMQELQGAMAIAKLKKEMEAQKAFADMYGPNAKQGGNPAINPETAGDPTFPQQAPGAQGAGPTLGQIGQLMGNDPERGKAALELWKVQHPDIKWEGGVPLDPKTGQPISGAPTMPQTNPQGFSTTNTWNPVTKRFDVGLTGGGMDAFKAQQDAQEEAKAKRDLVKIMVDGREVSMPREQAVKLLTDQYAPKPPQKVIAPIPGMVPQQDMAAFNAVANGSTTSALGAATKLGVGQTGAEQAFDKGSAENAVKYRAGINERVSTGQDLMMRIGESENLLKDFQAGGGEGVRVKLAQTAQALGAPSSMVDGITRGDLGSAQAFQKIVVSQAMESLKQAMSTSSGTGAGRITQAEFKIFQEANPNLELDPRALTKIYSFAKKVHDRDYSEAQAFQGWVNDKKDPAAFQPYWASKMRDEMKKSDLKAITSSTGEQPQIPQGVKVTRVK